MLSLSTPWEFERDCAAPLLCTPLFFLPLRTQHLIAPSQEQHIQKTLELPHKAWFCHWCLRNESAKSYVWKPPARLLLLEDLFFTFPFDLICEYMFDMFLMFVMFCYVCLFLQFSTAWHEVVFKAPFARFDHVFFCVVCCILDTIVSAAFPAHVMLWLQFLAVPEDSEEAYDGKGGRSGFGSTFSKTASVQSDGSSTPDSSCLIGEKFWGPSSRTVSKMLALFYTMFTYFPCFLKEETQQGKQPLIEVLFLLSAYCRL